MKKFNVEVKRLGSKKIEKSVDVENIDYDTLYGIVKPHLLSSSIGFPDLKEGEWGNVIGGWMTVGQIRFTRI